MRIVGKGQKYWLADWINHLSPLILVIDGQINQSDQQRDLLTVSQLVSSVSNQHVGKGYFLPFVQQEFMHKRQTFRCSVHIPRSIHSRFALRHI